MKTVPLVLVLILLASHSMAKPAPEFLENRPPAVDIPENAHFGHPRPLAVGHYPVATEKPQTLILKNYEKA